MSTIKLNVTEHLLTLGSNTLITEGSQNVDGVIVEFDSSWDGYAKIVVFSKKNQLEYTVLDESEFGKIPNEILTSNSEINICVIGIKDSLQLTTNIVKLRIKESLEMILEEPDEDVYRQILTQYTKILNSLTSTNAKVDKYQQDMTDEVQKTKNAVNTLDMKYVESLESVSSVITGTCEVYRMGAMLLVNYSIENVNTSYTPSVVFTYSESIPTCKKSTLISQGTISVMSNEGNRNISVVNPATSGADKSSSGQLIVILEPEDGEFVFNTRIVEELPTGDKIDTNCIYFVRNGFSTENHLYTEYVYINGSWEIIGESDAAGIANEVDRINYIPMNYEKKNILKVTAKTQEKNGVKFTTNPDGTILVNGTASATTVLDINTVDLAENTYILTGCPTGGGDATYKMDVLIQGSDYKADTGKGATYTVASQYVGTHRCRIVIYAGVTVENLSFKPMLRLASNTDGTFEPYIDSAQARITRLENIIEKLINK